MFRAYLLHFNLHRPVLWINVVKKLFARLAVVCLDLSIEIFIYMDDAFHPEAEVIERSPLIVIRHASDRLSE